MKGSVFLNTDFSRNLVLLRKEKGLSQKKVSEDLSISQALLSHYEKGIRECGLEFVVKTADYFGVSCDFLLGRSDKREPHRPEPGGKLTEGSSAQNPINGSVNIVLGILKKINSKSLYIYVTNYLSAAVYTMFRMLYSSSEKNPQQLFKVESDLYAAVASSKMAMARAKCKSLLNGSVFDDGEKISKEKLPVLNISIIEAEFPKNSHALFDLIDRVEKD